MKSNETAKPVDALDFLDAGEFDLNIDSGRPESAEDEQPWYKKTMFYTAFFGGEASESIERADAEVETRGQELEQAANGADLGGEFDIDALFAEGQDLGAEAEGVISTIIKESWTKLRGLFGSPESEAQSFATEDRDVQDLLAEFDDAVDTSSSWGGLKSFFGSKKKPDFEL